MSITPGIYPDLKAADYHRDAALGSTSLKTLATRTPAQWLWESQNPVQKDIYDLGTVAHSLILEGDTSGVVVIDVEAKRGKVWTEPAEEARAAGKIPLKTEEWVMIQRLYDAVMAHPEAKRAFTGHKAEHSVFWEEDGLMLKCRPDAWLPGLLVDLKSTVSADPREFRKTGYKLGYYQSAAHYQDGVRELTGETLPFVFVNVEKSPPYLVSVTEYDDEALDAGRRMNDRAKDIYRRCLETGEYPGYPHSGPISLPHYAPHEIEELTNV